MKETIYALTIDIDNTPYFFYVGRTIDQARRLKEHRANSYNPKHKEDVYEFIREHKIHEDFYMTDLEASEVDGMHYEDLWVIRLVREGYELQNMKHGDTLVIMNELIASGKDFNNVEVLKREKKAIEDRIAGERSARLRESINEQTIPTHQPDWLLEALENSRLRSVEECKRKAAKERKNEQKRKEREEQYRKEHEHTRHLFEELDEKDKEKVLKELANRPPIVVKSRSKK